MVHCTDVVNHSQQAAKLRAYIYLSSRTLNPRSQYHDSIRYVGAHCSRSLLCPQIPSLLILSEAILCAL
ncbi:hypothetical protein DTO207G8_2548 [Paecilomyces variotii]|nr:hypothetical protein DTO032I3_2014 [Paecilomyces variotii]KAJ9256545.1 hypothetical protein DTO207G8_2548 [Paecilomyces variotii]KAJ9281648.1 hypothetical protein DTO021D3_1414 [Paecilomyces variotii]KAJ9345910.1 hypothetical protein DTO027B6_1324 [Paecilomyces variotii]KAJ9374549.1 hypothetical protein DTO282E5_632 [Paecilomyces variotii]